MSTENQQIRSALEQIERTRKQRGISIREAAGRVPRISEGYWRQFVAGGVSQSGVWVPKIPTVEQVVKMATAVGVGAQVAEGLGVEAPADWEPAPAADVGELAERVRGLEAQLEEMRAALARLDVAETPDREREISG